MLAQFLKTAFPSVPEAMADAVAAQLSQAMARPDVSVLKAEIDTLKAKLSEAEDEILRLRQEAITYRLGVKNASDAGLRVLAERARQKSEEGFSDEHDDTNDDGFLLSASIAYLIDARLREQGAAGFKDTPPTDWPYPAEKWKPKKSIKRQKEMAAAMIIADVDTSERTGRDQI